MAAGDVINFLANGVVSFQPAAGVEIIVLRVFGNAGTLSTGISDGATSAQDYFSPVAPYQQLGSSNKFGITNSEYFILTPSSAFVGFSGIQIK